MKNVRKITKLRLDHDGVDELILIGLVSAEPDYKLSFSINKKLHISLKNSSPVTTGDGNTFSNFTASDSSGTTYSLIANRSDKSLLLAKLKNVDYLFVVHDPDKEVNTGNLISLLRETGFINAAFIMERDFLKDKNIQYLIR